MATATFQTTAQAIAYALGEPPQAVDWAIGYLWPDGETTYCDARGERDARREAEDINFGAASHSLRPNADPSHPVRAWAAYRETRVLSDGMQIISPWTEAKEQ